MFAPIPAKAETPYSAMLTGPLGLNIVPSARMAPQGTASIGISTLDPYAHAYLGFQVADPLYINLRQSAEVSNLNEDADRLFPGVDLKLRLKKESEFIPEIALGLQSALGHKRMAGEYLALSKRYHDLDFTLGMGWGRYGTAGHFDNPLKGLFSHFGKDRSDDGEFPNEPDDWFTGEKVGVFGGIEYFTPVQGLSLKLDWGADRYSAERTALNFDTPAPWGVGVNYAPSDWANISVGAQGTEKIMGRLSLHSPIKKWPLSDDSAGDPHPMRPYRTELALPEQMRRSAENDNILMYDTELDGLYKARTHMEVSGTTPTPKQIGRALRHMSNHAGPAVEKFEITPTNMNLRGPSITVMRRDVEMAIARQQGSPQEIWHNASFSDADHSKTRFITTSNRSIEIRALLDHDLSLSEEDHGTLYRTSLITDLKMPEMFGLLTSGTAMRLNIKDNLEKINDFRPRALLPVRSDVDEFAERTFGVERSYLAATHSLTPDWHGQISWGYLEEMYGGIGGEILYRPFSSRFAIGAEAWQVFKRDPDTTLNTGLNGDHLLTGHVNAWYDIPGWDITAHAKAGRYLAEDIGGTLSLEKNFKNGARLDAFVTVTDQADFDVFGGTTHAHHGIRLSVPLGAMKKERVTAKTRVNISPLGRDTGQALNPPISLYEETEAFSARHLIQQWNGVVD